MKRALKVAGAALAIVLLLVAGVVGAAVWLGERKLEREVLVRVVPVPFASGPAALKQGRYIFETRGCASCHGPDGSGRVMIDEPNGLFVRTPNITRGSGSVVATATTNLGPVAPKATANFTVVGKGANIIGYRYAPLK